MKKELLSPAGNMETLYQAIHNGADAIYLGGKSFGARKFANNFSNEELIEAIKYAHLYGVKIYVTANTLIYEEEINDFLEYIKFLYLNNVDAVIMQDIGMMVTVREMFPELNIYASTQSHNHNDEGLRVLKDMGVKRVILDREMSLTEISNLKTDIEKEIFIQGALCVCYSGCCLFSSLNGGRSGNRGECVGSCRLPYQLMVDDQVIKTDGDYLLSTKDLNTTMHLKEILDSNIVSLKIEGRMKSPEYVGFVTRLYRTLIDKYYEGKPLIINEEDINSLKKLFNREFTNGYLFNDYGHKLMNIKSPNHIGINIGKTIKIANDKIYISLNEDLNQEDGIRFIDNNEGMIINKLYNEKGLLVNHISKGSIAVVDNKINLKNNSLVLKTTDSLLVKELANYSLKKIGIDIKIKAIINLPLIMEVTDNNSHLIKEGPIVEPSITSPLSYDKIKEQASKLGDTPFVINNLHIEMDNNIFISIKELNTLRRSIINDLIDIRRNITSNHPINELMEDHIIINKTKTLNVLVWAEEQLQASLDKKIDHIYVVDESLYNKYKDYKNIYYRIPRVSLKLHDYQNTNLLVSELGGICKYPHNNNVISDSYLNVVNSKSALFFHKQGVKTITLSPEISYERLKLLPFNLNLEIIIYGRIELMIMKYCPLNMLINNDLKPCSVCHNHQYYLKNNNNKYPIVTNDCLTYIMHYKNIDLINNIKDYFNLGITNYRLELFNESYPEVINLIESIQKEINN